MLDPGGRRRGSLRRRGCSQMQGFANNQVPLRQRLRCRPTPSSGGVSGQRAPSLSGPGAPPAPGAPLHRALVPAAGEERPPRKGQAEPRTRTSVSGWQCAPHFTLSRVLPHAPSHSQQASSHLHRAGGGGAKTGLRSQGTNPRRQPAQHLQDRGELRQPARPGDAAWHVRTAHHPWTKPGW